MYFFQNDYGELAHPDILNAMIAANLVPEQGYYNDSHSEKAREYILRELGSSADAEIHFTPGGTLTNVIALAVGAAHSVSHGDGLGCHINGSGVCNAVLGVCLCADDIPGTGYPLPCVCQKTPPLPSVIVAFFVDSIALFTAKY